MALSNSVASGTEMLSSDFMNILHSMEAAAQYYFLFTVGVCVIVTAVSFIKRYKKEIIRFLVSVIVRVMYRFRAHGRSRIDMTKPALYACSHFSWIDALLISVAVKRPVRFLMSREYYNKLRLKPLLKAYDVIPLSFTDGPHALGQAFDKARAALDNGESVCIFPEGTISRTGYLNKFNNGYGKIVGGTAYPVVPMHIDGSWGTAFSYCKEKRFSLKNMFSRKKITVLFGNPCISDIPVEQLKIKVSELMTEACSLDKATGKSLGNLFVRAARRHPFQEAMVDTTGKKLSYSKAVTAYLILADILMRDHSNEESIGMLLPASVGGALANIGCNIAGKVPVNINFTGSTKAVQSAVEQCHIRTIITSKRFVAKLKQPDLPCDMLYLEDILKQVTPVMKIKALIKTWTVPADILTHEKKGVRDAVATIMFSSGSTSEPKGIVLSHHNIISDIEMLTKAMRFGKEDALCAALPFFHSFGYTATIWFPLITGFKVCYHPNPLDGEIIAKVVRENRATILLATPTFLKAYNRKAKKEDFPSLRLIIVGAEKLKKDLADSFEKKFSIRPLEGYGATELSPVVSLNLPEVAIGNKKYTRRKEGSVGMPLNGITARVVNPDTFEDLRYGESGLLLIKGPNVMQGYLSKMELTEEAVKDGWYNTGDIAVIDEYGYITLTDRLSRYSKIGGEMIPRGAVEDILQSSIETEDQVVAVTAVPDEKRGEKLIVLYTHEAGGEERLQVIIENADIPNLWKPVKDAYVPVDSIPVLGTGKTDLKGLKQIALQWQEEKTLRMAA